MRERDAIVRLLRAACDEQELTGDAWDDPEAVLIVQEDFVERLDLWAADYDGSPATFAALLDWAEAAVRAQWDDLNAVTDPDAEALAATLATASAIADRRVGPDERLAEVAGEWASALQGSLPAPWNRCPSAAPKMERSWLPGVRTLVAIGLWLLLGVALIRWEGMVLAARLLFWGVALLFVLEYGGKTTPRWVDTPATWAAGLAANWRRTKAALESLRESPPT